ncbi:MAG: hypothetical protein ABR985_02525 [Methanotrichaceae archaeon]|jgi:hypothetical protein
MSKERIFIIGIITILFSVCSANGDYVIPSLSLNEDGSFLISQMHINNLSFSGEPAYRLESQPSSNRVNVGDKYSMKIFVSGAGDVAISKMRINIPAYIVEDENVFLKEVDFNYSFKSKSNTIKLAPLITTKNLTPPMTLNVPNIYFIPYDIKAFVNFGELTTIGNVPYTINFTISPNAPKGDHNIYLTLFYKSGDKWYTDTETVPLHINNWYEQEWLQWLILISLFTSIILQAIPVIEGYRKK